MENLFNFLKIETKLNYTKSLIAMGISYGIGLLSFLLVMFSKYVVYIGIRVYDFTSIFYTAYGISLFIGIIFAATSFTEIYEKKWAVFYFTLPSNPEIKVISKLLFTSLGYFIFNIIFMLVTSLFVVILAKIFSIPYTIYTFKDFLLQIERTFFVYIFFHSIYFMFSVIWNKNSFFKTTGIILGIGMLISTFISLTAFVIFSLFVDKSYFTNNIDLFTKNKWIITISKIFYFLLPYFFYFLSYIEFKKKKIINS